MISQEIRGRPWTLCGLIGAFLDLGIAYFLLCVSTFVFFQSKFLSIVGLFLPCPCNGIFGFRNGNFCWHRLLIDWPIRKIYDVQLLAKSRFPFNLVRFRDDSRENRVVELDGEGSSVNQSLVDRESVSGVRGKRGLNLKLRSRIRRRKRANLAYGKVASVFPSDNLPSVSPIVPSPYEGGEAKDKYAESLMEDGPQDDISASIGNKGEASSRSFELSESFGEGNDTDKNSIFFERYIDDMGEKKSFQIVGSALDTIRLLERALQEEKAASAALCLELDKERAAAATAADEAMAMISRLQKDKAAMETESRQYLRMIDEKFAYDEEEIDILKEILVKREKENHFLEKEIETYRRMSVTGDEQSNGDTSDTLDESGQRSLSSFYSSADPELVLHKTVNAKPCSDDMESTADSPSSHEVQFVEKQRHSNEHESIKEGVLAVDSSDGSYKVDENSTLESEKCT